MIDFKKIHQLQQELNILLENDPKAMEYQKNINRELKKAGKSHHNRCAILENMLRENQKKLFKLIKELKQQTDELGREIKNEQ